MTHPQIIELDQQITDLEHQKADIAANRATLLVGLVNAALNRNLEPHQIAEGGWECPDPQRAPLKDGEGEPHLHSPSGRCIYVWAETGEECIFCGSPEERL